MAQIALLNCGRTEVPTRPTGNNRGRRERRQRWSRWTDGMKLEETDTAPGKPTAAHQPSPAMSGSDSEAAAQCSWRPADCDARVRRRLAVGVALKPRSPCGDTRGVRADCGPSSLQVCSSPSFWSCNVHVRAVGGLPSQIVCRISGRPDTTTASREDVARCCILRDEMKYLSF
ncbi:hypothetical protein B0T18DRAFT_126624 [Schizothecium vesticola]|uniref:Uncharacterized protein n=1 Tax=Schizothecium vesticola TaxID=314040 RepID=A0AA40F388_9PEZI|nr:hypothetical protein B0T18DRAFT_126624 [Schizothecium vesticola]